MIDDDDENLPIPDNVPDRRGQVWEDPGGRLHLIVGAPRAGHTRAVFHKTLRLLSGEVSSLTDMPDYLLEQRLEWRRIA